MPPVTRLHLLALVVTTLASSACQTHQPPAVTPAVGLARTALAAPGIRWDSLTGTAGAAPLTVYVQPGSHAAAHAPALRQRAERAVDDALTLIGEARYPSHLRVFHVDSREQMRALVGAGTTGWTAVDAHAVFVVASPTWVPFTRHEVMHAVSLTLWGEPRDRAGWLREGLPAAAENRCGASTGRGVAARLLAEGTLPRLGQLVHDFDALARADDLAAYLGAGALVQYLLERRDAATLARVWRGGAAGMPGAYGESLPALDAAWRAWLAATPASEQPATYAALSARGCG